MFISDWALVPLVLIFMLGLLKTLTSWKSADQNFAYTCTGNQAFIGSLNNFWTGH